MPRLSISRRQRSRQSQKRRVMSNAIAHSDLPVVTAPDIANPKEAEILPQCSAEETRRINDELAFYKFALDEAAIVVVTDSAGTISYVNENFCRISGYRREELLGKDHRLLYSDIHPKIFITEMYALLASGELWRGEICNRAKDGHFYWMDKTIIPTQEIDGTATRYVGIGADITARKNAEEALIKAGALQSAIFNSANFSSIATDAKGVIQIFNVGAERMLGYSAVEVMNKITPADISDPQEVITRAEALSVELGTPITPGFEALVFKASRGIEDIYELTYIRKDGSRFPAVVSVTALRDPRDAIIGYLLIGTDNTARKQVDDALRKSETQLHTIIENISEAVVVSDLNGQLLHFNQAALNMLGYASLDEGRRNFGELADTFELSGPDGAAWTVEQWPVARILRGEKLHDLEARMRRIGTDWERVYSFGGTIAHDASGKPLMAVVTFSDITERQRAESAALRLAAIVESSTDAVIGKDLNSIVTSWNDAAERIFGYSADEMVGRPITLIMPTDHQGEEEHIQSKIGRGERVEHFETERLRKDGGLVDISVTVSPIKDSQGRVIGASKVARDITGRKRVEVALRESEERFRLLVEGVHEYAIILLDLDGRVVSWNAGAERLKGYKAEEIIGRSFCVFYPPDDIAAGKPTMELKLAAELGRWEDEGWRVRADGARFWANVLITALKDDAGNLRGFSKLTRDITERKQAEEALLKAGALQNAIFNSANFSSIATDAKGVIQIFNVGAERMLGYTAVEVMNKITPADISDPQEVITRAEALSVELGTPITPGFEALVFKASRGIEDIYELTYIRKDGSRFPAVVSVTALRDAQNAIIGYLLIGTDNTARKHAEEALIKAGALQSAIFNSANFSSIATDAKGVIQIFNVGAERMLGYSAAEVMNKITPADISDPQEVITRAEALSAELGTPITPGFEALVFKASRGIEDIYSLTYIRKDGSRFPAVVSVTALRDAQNAIIGYLLIGTDNTARIEAEGKISRWNTELEQRIADRTAELAETNSDLEAFTYSVSHDLRAPLRAIDGFSRIVETEYAVSLPEEAKRFLGLVRSNVQQMGQLVEDLLALCRHGRQTIATQVVKPDDIAQQVWKDLNQWPSGRTIKFEMKKLEPCRADPALLKQVFINLLSNAIKFTRTCEKTEIIVGDEKDEAGEVVYFVKDNGVGFDMRYVHKLFGVFQRLHRAEDYAGTGVGLAIVQRIIKRHGGRVWAQSEPDKGTTIYFTLGSKKHE
jgi:PAS domain S-box-containing protein